MVYHKLRKGKKAITEKDIRWKFCNIKCISRLASILLLEKAAQKNADDCILIRDGYVYEAAFSNVFIVQNGTIITPPPSTNNLMGTSRSFAISIIKQRDFAFEEKNITYEELVDADEIWLTSASRGITPIIKLDTAKVADGKAGPVWEKLIKIYLEELIKIERRIEIEK